MSPFLQLLPESCFLRSAPLIWVAWTKMQSKRVRLSKMINLHALVLRPSLLATALTMSYCQLSWGREQQFSYNAAFTTSRPAEQKCRFSPQFHIFLNAPIDWSPLPFCQTSELNHDRGKIEMTSSNTRFEIVHREGI